MEVLYIDMDDVLVNFCGHPKVHPGKYKPIAMYEKGFFLNLEPLPGALRAVRALLHSGKYYIYILTQPVAESPYSYMEKAQWIWKWFPELGNNIIMTQEKGLNSGHGRILIDDNKKKWQGPIEHFGGRFIHFQPLKKSEEMWEIILQELLGENYKSTI